MRARCARRRRPATMAACRVYARQAAPQTNRSKGISAVERVRGKSAISVAPNANRANRCGPVAGRARRRVRRGAYSNARHANADSPSRAHGDRYARAYANAASADRDRDAHAYGDARPAADRDAYPRPNPGPAVRPPRIRPRAPCADGDGNHRAYGDPNPAANANGDPDHRAHGNTNSAADRDADARAARRMARRRPHWSERGRPRSRRNPHTRRRLVLDDRGGRRRQIRPSLLLRHLVTEVQRRVSDAQRPLRRLQRRRRDRRGRLLGQRRRAWPIRPPAQPRMGVRRGAADARPRLQRPSAIVVDGHRRRRRDRPLAGLRRRLRGLLARRP